MARAEVQKIIIRFSNSRIPNTALRFKFNSLNGRYQAFKRQWDSTLRQIEAGTYKRHVFRADLHDRERGIEPDAKTSRPAATSGGPDSDIFETYRDAMLATGQDASGLTRAKLEKAIAKQEAALQKKFGCERVDPPCIGWWEEAAEFTRCHRANSAAQPSGVAMRRRPATPCSCASRPSSNPRICRPKSVPSFAADGLGLSRSLGCRASRASISSRTSGARRA